MAQAIADARRTAQVLLAVPLLLAASPVPVDPLLVRQADGTYAPGPIPAATRAQACFRYNNYWCLKGIGWEGKTGIGEQNLVVFSDPAWSARAFAITMRTYQFRHKLLTPRQVMSRFILSPACLGGGRTTAGCEDGWRLVDRYARQIAAALAIGPDDAIGLFKSRYVINADKAHKMFRTIAHIEIGISVQVTDALIDEGLRLAGIKLG
jgi:hypothetical protein